MSAGRKAGDRNPLEDPGEPGGFEPSEDPGDPKDFEPSEEPGELEESGELEPSEEPGDPNYPDDPDDLDPFEEPGEPEDPSPVEINQVSKLAPGLYILPTPLGNLGDLSRRAVEVLTGVDLVVSEDTRRTLKILSHLGLRKRRLSYREQNHDRAWPAIRDVLRRGGRVALVSDAGAPAVSDPGARLVAEVRADGRAIFPIPGPSAVITALMASGLTASAFTFGGFLPPSQTRRRARLAELKGLGHPLVLFESPVRLAASLSDMADVLGPRPALVARELTKLHEELMSGDLRTLAEDVARNPRRGEMTVVIAPAPKRAAEAEADPEIDPDSIAAAIAQDQRPTKVIAAELGKTLGRPRKEMYDLVVSIRGRLRFERD